MKSYDDIYDVSFFIITENDDYIDVNDYNQKNDKGLFVMMTNELLNSDYGEDNSIVISCDKILWKKLNTINKVNGGLKWFSDKEIQISKQDIDDVLEDMAMKFNGYAQTMNLLSCNNDREDIVLKKIHDLVIDYKGQTLYGYLPSLSQMDDINRNIGRIKDILQRVGVPVSSLIISDKSDGFLSNGLLKYPWWTSNVYNEELMWCVEQYMFPFKNGNHLCKVLPLYKLK